MGAQSNSVYSSIVIEDKNAKITPIKSSRSLKFYISQNNSLKLLLNTAAMTYYVDKGLIFIVNGSRV